MNTISLSRMVILAFVFALCVTASFAQQIPVNIPGGDQDFPGIAPSSPTRGVQMNPRMYPPPTRGSNINPSMYQPQSVSKCGPPAPPSRYPCPPPECKSANVNPSAYLGYLYATGAGFQIQLNNVAQQALASTREELNLQGLWLELAATMDICKNVTAVFTGAHLFAFQPSATQWYTITGSPSAGRQWNPDVQWWEVNTAGAYQLCPGISAVAGFRWTSFGVNFTKATKQVDFNAANGDSATLNTNLYIPYSGLLLESNPDCQSNFKVAAYGCPVLPGNLAYTETMSFTNLGSMTLSPNVNLYSGYFVEALSEYSMRTDKWNLGGFVRFTAVHSERSVGLPINGVSTPADFTFDRKNWIFGGKIGFGF